MLERRGAKSSGLVQTNNINETSTKQKHTKSNRGYLTFVKNYICISLKIKDFLGFSYYRDHLYVPGKQHETNNITLEFKFTQNIGYQ
jgi:hypothetical protein